MDIASLAELIRSRYQQLSPSERRVADKVLGSPLLMSGFTATELADVSQVSKATITRFVDRLGLASFDEFRRIARDDPHMFMAGSPLRLMDEGLAATHGDLRLLVQETARRDGLNLERTYAEIRIEDLAETVRLLSESRLVMFADFRKQYALAYYSSTLFRVIRPGVNTLPLVGATAVDGMLDLGAEDLVVMFPFRRPTRDQDVLSRAVIDTSASLVTIGDIWPSPASQRASIHLSCRTESVGVFDSFVAPSSLINLLFAATANQLGGIAQERLACLEDMHDTFETFTDGYAHRTSEKGKF
ncbi:MurR/RpiR family transcriptional regulator [soil metagenome]